ncbi:restriction endonuclease subunit S [Campylobacter sp. 9BO]|uniref:restriction endonuclease subunit S n=1 Tax=Campylobacter sp. 9BO TaxID=3424759 RepID=UPI003D35103F
MTSNLNQTLQSKYPNLEISVLKISEVKENNENFRIDSEPFKKSNLITNQYIDYVKLSDIALINPSKTEISNLNLDTEVSFISMQNLGTGNINDRETGTIKDYKTGYTYFAENDILIAKITPCMEHGKCSIATNLKNKIGFGSTEFNVFRINDNRFVKEFVFCFLNMENIRKIAADNMIGTSGRQRVPTNFYENLLIPLFPIEFQQQIEQMVRQSHECLEQSKGLYRQAEILLYEEIGLDPNDPLSSIQPLSNRLNVSVQTLKQSFLATGRLDSEYYQQKYDDIENLIKNYHNGYMRLKDIGNFANGSLISEDFYVEKAKRAYIRIKELSFNSPIKIEESVYIDDNFEAKNETAVKENDFIIATIGNTIGKVNLVPKELSGSFISNNTSKFSLFDKNIMPEFLELLLRSVIVQEQIQRDFTQTAQPKISNYSLENILIPKFSLKIQESIAKNLQKSFDLRSEAKNLLKNAKERVENSIIVGGG